MSPYSFGHIAQSSLSQAQTKDSWLGGLGSGAMDPHVLTGVVQLSMTGVTAHPSVPWTVPVYTCGPSKMVHSRPIDSHKCPFQSLGAASYALVCNLLGTGLKSLFPSIYSLCKSFEPTDAVEGGGAPQRD